LEGGLDRYITGDIGTGYLVVRPVERGELLPRSAVAPAGELEDVRHATVPVPASELPAGLAPGDAADVWLVREGAAAAASLLLPGVRVTATTSPGGGLATASGQHGVTRAVVADGAAADSLEEVVAELVAGARSGEIYLSRLPEVLP